MKMAGMETAEIETVGEAAFGAAILIFVCLAGLWRFRLNSGKEKGGRGKLLPFCVGVFALTAGVLWAEARIFTLDAQEQWVKERQEKGVNHRMMVGQSRFPKPLGQLGPGISHENRRIG